MVIRLIDVSDAVLASEAVTAAVDELVGDGDRGLMLELLTEADYRGDDGRYDPTPLGRAVSTPPFLTERRVVVARHLARFPKKAQYEPILAIVDRVLDTTDLVLVWERGTNAATGKPEPGTHPALPKALKEGVEVGGGAVTKVATGSGKAAGEWLREQLAASSLIFDNASTRAVADLLGEERSRVVGLVRTLEGALGAGAKVTADDVAAFGGESGSVVPWELDDAIDKGDAAAALEVLRRLLPTRHPFQLLATLHGRYQRMLRLDGAGVGDEKAAAHLLGMKGSTFPAKKLLAQSRKLGSEKIARAIALLAEADLQLRGTVDWSDEMVLEVLVARLAALSGRR